MDAKLRFFVVLTIISVLVASCGGASAPTAVPAATEPPATSAPTEEPATQPPATQAPTEAPATQSPVPTLPPLVGGKNCSVTPDGQQYGGHKGPLASGLTILDKPHGIYVYNDLINQVNPEEFQRVDLLKQESLSEFKNLDQPEASITNLVVILIVDTFFDEAKYSGFDGTNSLSSTYPWIMRYDLFENIQNKDKALLIVAVDTYQLSLDSITQNIPKAIEIFEDPNGLKLDIVDLPTSAKIVVNMSFVLVPCDVIATDGSYYKSLSELYSTNSSFKESVNANVANLKKRLEALKNKEKEVSPVDFQDYLDDAILHAYIVKQVYESSDKTWLEQNQQGDENIFYDVLKQIASDKVVFVGAAGNFGEPFSYAPASWDFVESISSEPSAGYQTTLTNGLTLADYSNWGEIQEDGVFSGSPVDPGTSVPSIVGTSFAAPKFSYKIAHYLLVEAGNNPCGNSLSALGYSTVKDPWPANTDNNLPYTDAMQMFCP